MYIQKSLKNIVLLCLFFLSLLLITDVGLSKEVTCKAVDKKAKVHVNKSSTVSTTADKRKKECTFSVNNASASSSEKDNEIRMWIYQTRNSRKSIFSGQLDSQIYRYLPYMITSSLQENRNQVIGLLSSNLQSDNNYRTEFSTCFKAFLKKRRFKSRQLDLKLNTSCRSVPDDEALIISIEYMDKTTSFHAWKWR